jgi:membrane protein DedA with SNARE-associated domain
MPEDPSAERSPDPAPESAVPVSDAGADGEHREPEWWEDPRMPWKGKPGRRDIACWIAFSLTGVYALVLLPLRPVLLGANPYLLAALGGSRTSTVTIGALYATGVGWWPLGLLLGTFGAMKFDAIFWWAGRLWGRGLIEMVAGRSARSARNADRAERLARKYGVAAILLGYVVPLPSAVIYATLGATGMRLRTFLLVDVLGAAVTRGIYIYLGYRIGQPAVDVVQMIAKYSLYLSLVLLAGVVLSAIRRSRQRPRVRPGQAA